MRLVHNESSQFALRQVDLASRSDPETLEKLTTGRRINHASDDAAGLSVASRFASRYRGLVQANRNLQDASSLVQVAESAYATTTDMLHKIRQMSVQSSNDTLTDSDRGLLQKEVDQLLDEIDRQGETVQFNGKKFLQGGATSSVTFHFHAGADENEEIAVEFSAVNASAFGLTGLQIGTRDTAENAIATVDSALAEINGRRAELGAIMNRIDRAIDFTSVAGENAAAAESNLADSNMGEEVVSLSKSQLLSQTRLSALAQANIVPQSVLTLLG
ncbi:MAG: flagellin [Candidatus Hydrogenedentota bacterium]